MKKLLLIIPGIMASFTSVMALADEPKPDNDVTFNVAATSDYRYRGLTQTRYKPAIQGGADYVNNPTGLYAGTWLSSIKWIDDIGGDSKVEWDIYAGKRGNFTEDFTYDVGALSYVYAGNDLGKVDGWADANTTEVYGQLGYGPAYAKYSYSTTNLFGTIDSKGSTYLDVGANIDLGNKFTLNLHAGRQTVKNTDKANYNDYKIGVTKDFDVVVLSLAVIGTSSADKSIYSSPKTGEFLGKSTLVATVSKTF